MRCATCPWFQRVGGGTHGVCMHEPPVIQVVMPAPNALTGKVQPAVQGLRPPTGANDRCSRHPEWLSGKGRLLELPVRAAQ